MTLWNDFRGWTSAKAAALRLCLRMTVAGSRLPDADVRIAAGLLVGIFGNHHHESSVGGSVKATIDRVVGTIGGAVTGGVVAYLLPHDSAFSAGVALAIALVPLTLVAALWSR